MYVVGLKRLPVTLTCATIFGMNALGTGLNYLMLNNGYDSLRALLAPLGISSLVLLVCLVLVCAYIAGTAWDKPEGRPIDVDEQYSMPLVAVGMTALSTVVMAMGIFVVQHVGHRQDFFWVVAGIIFLCLFTALLAALCLAKLNCALLDHNRGLLKQVLLCIHGPVTVYFLYNKENWYWWGVPALIAFQFIWAMMAAVLVTKKEKYSTQRA